MLSMKRILVPLDFDESTEHSIDVAIELARRCDAKITLMHAWFIPPVPYGGPFTPVVDEIRRAAEVTMDAALARVRERFPASDCVLSGGDPGTRIIAAAQEIDADLIVIASHGRRGLARAVLGSVAERVVRLSPIPVLTVPPQHKSAQEPIAAQRA